MSLLQNENLTRMPLPEVNNARDWKNFLGQLIAAKYFFDRITENGNVSEG